jgi:hypothetical protein
MNEDENEEWACEDLGNSTSTSTDYCQVLPSIKGLAGYSTYGYSAYPLLHQVWVIQ